MAGMIWMCEFAVTVPVLMDIAMMLIEVLEMTALERRLDSLQPEEVKIRELSGRQRPIGWVVLGRIEGTESEQPMTVKVRLKVEPLTKKAVTFFIKFPKSNAKLVSLFVC